LSLLIELFSSFQSLKLSKTALGQTATGQIVNLLANDVSRFDMLAYFIHLMWTSIMILFIVSWIVVAELGTPGMFGIVVVLIVCPIQCKFKLFGSLNNLKN